MNKFVEAHTLLVTAVTRLLMASSTLFWRSCGRVHRCAIDLLYIGE